MCGFAGVLEHGAGRSREAMSSLLAAMTDAIHHRGPDDVGIWTEPEAGVGFGFRRLAILDLSPEGHQPMRSASGRYTMMFNGEVYNFAALRKELEALGHAFRGHSDTEVMLAALEQWGLEQAVPRFWGMFAIALWDRETRRLHLVRDRLGKKPLYYGWQGGAFLFGSELKSLRAHPAFNAEIDRDALALYLRHNYIPGPYSIYRGIRKLRPGAILTVDPRQPGLLPEPAPYWDPKAVAEKGQADPFRGTEAEAEEALDGLLKDAVGLRMVADVPVGAFLSGGIDSSVVVGLMQAQSSRPVRTFSIGFDESGYNEAEHAKAVAAHLGTEHTELYVRPEEARAVIPKLPHIYDEPFSDSSQIPTFLVSQLARRDVTVALSGDGGDEMFGGYNRYFVGMRLIKRLGWIPRPLRSGLAAAIHAGSPKAWDRFVGAFERVIPKRHHGFVSGERLHKLAGMLTVEDVQDLYRRAVSHWPEPERILREGREHPGILTDRSRWAALPDPTHTMMYLDLISYLVDDILVKVDRATMAVSLEGRAPLLDHRVAEFAWTLPLDLKVRGGRGKHILRKVLDRYVPRELIDRPKQGFGVPIGDWLRGPLKDWAEALLDARRLEQEGFFRPEPIRRKWAEHLSGSRNWQYYLWDVLMFQTWLESQRSSVQGV